MKLKHIVSALLASSLAITSLTMPTSYVYAESTFSSASDFISDVINLAVTDIESSTMDTAKSSVLSDISVTGDQVFYKGSSIGYWYSTESSTLYGAADKSSKIISKTENGYEISPTTLNLLLTDLNSGLVDTYIPSTTDWSKIIGKYDVTLGGATVPAKQWVELTPTGDPLGENNFIDIYNELGWTGADLTNLAGQKTVFATTFLVSNTGELFLGNEILGVTNPVNSSYRPYSHILQGSAASPGTFPYTGGYSTSTTKTQSPYIRIGLTAISDTKLQCRLTASDFTCSASSRYQFLQTYADHMLFKVGSPNIVNTCIIDNAKTKGIVYMTGEQLGITSESELSTVHTNFFTSYSSSKVTIGNNILNRRLSKLPSLLPTDTIEVKATGWTINGVDDIESYIGTQDLGDAGDTADISAVADIDALHFNVIVPTSLPIYVDSSNVVYVADNANIINKSGAAVKITEVEVIPNDESGWTSVEGNPSKVRDANEFNFSTSIEKDKVLEVDEVYPFEYRAKLSPTTNAQQSLELASVLVTVDWAT